MWPRICELILGVWILVGAWLLSGESFGRTWSVVLGGVVIAMSIASFFRRFRYAHVVTLLVGFGMIVLPLTKPFPVSAVLQNVEVMGWLLAMFAVIPSRSNEPPPDWAAMDDARERSGQA